MDHQTFTSRHNSGDSSPQSRENHDIEQNPSSFDEQNQNSSNNYKVKLMISYGGKIQPRLHDNHFSYIGGDTKILTVDRTVKFSTVIAKLSSIANFDACFKYQLPGEDLDALISVTNEEDLDHMMIEYDRLSRASPKPARLRLFLFPFPVNNASSGSSVAAVNFAAAEASKSDGQWFIDALNSVHVPPVEDSSSPPVTTNPDYLFGLDKPYSAAPADSEAPEANQAEFPATVTDFAVKETECGTETVRETEIQELKLQNNEQQNKIDGENGGINGGVTGIDCYSQESTEKAIPLVTNEPVQKQVISDSVQFQIPVHVPGPGSVPVQSPFSPLSHNVACGGPGGYSIGYPNEPTPVYLIQTPSGLYQAVRPVTGPTGQPVYFAYSQIVNNGVGVGSDRGYSYFPDTSALPRQTAAAPGGGEGWN